MDARETLLAYRAAGHHLGRRLARTGLLQAVGAIGVRDVRGSAAAALHARVSGFTLEMLDAALEDGSVVEVTGARGASTLAPTEDVETFTLGTIPADEASLRHRLRPLAAELDASGLSATDGLARAVDIARDTLSSGPVDIGVLSGALTRRLPELSPMCRGRCGVEHIDQGLFDLVGESGVWSTLHADGTRIYTALPEPSTSRSDARRELVRRYLRCHGPSTVQQFSEWCGIGKPDARASLHTDDTTEVTRGCYALARDAKRLGSPPEPHGIRLLPSKDPYLEGRDRATLVPDRTIQMAIWRAVPILGIVLIDGDAVATWKAKKAGDRLDLTIDWFTASARHLPDQVGDEARAIATLRECDDVRVDVSSGR